MIKKILFNFILIFFFSLVIILLILSTKGIETNKFNKLIISKVNQIKNISLELNTINFKLDPKELSLFLETKKPKIKTWSRSSTILPSWLNKTIYLYNKTK